MEENTENYQGDESSLLSMKVSETFGKEDHVPVTKKTEKETKEILTSELISSLKKTLFVIGTLIVVLIAVSNSVAQQLERFWGSSGDFWQLQWDRLLATFGNDRYTLAVYGSIIVSYIVYWGVGFFYIFMDVTLKPDVFRRYKIQPGTNEPVDNWKLLKVIGVVHFNQIVVTYLAMVLSYHVMEWRGYDSSTTLPTFHWVLFEIVVCILMEEVGFYYSHRLFHHRMFYKRFHKLHHEWQSPISVTAIYAHPLEHFVSNLLPGLLGPFIMGSHLCTGWLWFQLAQLSTLNAHSGYHLPFFPSPEAHDYHHLKFNQCYGVLGVLDLLHGTDDRFRSSRSFSRHIMSLTFTPLRELFPDFAPEEQTKGKVAEVAEGKEA